MTPRAAWAALRLDPGSDAAAVRQAYADRLRAMDIDGDPAGFALLRTARDAALADVRRQSAVATGPADDTFGDLGTGHAPAPEPGAPWPHAAPHIELPVPPGRVQSRSSPTPASPRPAASPASGPADSPLTLDAGPFSTPVLAVPAQGDVVADRGRAAAFQQLLYDAAPTEPLDGTSERRARDHLEALVRMAHDAPIEKSRAMEDWLVDQLARAWPRSAPLLAPAAAAFGWDGDHGQIGERPAVAFLNARLHGLRFVEAVERPDSPLYKVWQELSKPGAGRSWSVKRRGVLSLLAGIRAHFPEVEQYLNPDRVAAWEKLSFSQVLGINGHHWGKGLRNGWRWAVVVVVVMRLLAGLLGNDDPGGYRAHPPQLSKFGQIDLAPGQQRYQGASSGFSSAAFRPGGDGANQALDIASARWFGAGIDFAKAGRTAPRVAALAASNAGGTMDPRAADHAMRDAVFAGLHAQVYHADAATMRAIQSLRLEVLDASARIDRLACYDFMVRDQVDDKVEITPAQIAKARMILFKLAAEGVFGNDAKAEHHTTRISGAVINRIDAVTRLPDNIVREALMHRGANDNQCTVSRALIREALRLPPREGNPILRIQ